MRRVEVFVPVLALACSEEPRHPEPQSCASLDSSCAKESCCASATVPGGSFHRSYDGVSPEYADRKYLALVSAFALDRYEITVGRFRKFQTAWVGGWRPRSGAGKHAHLRQGRGLSVGGGSGTERGWNDSWNESLPADSAGWDAALSCHPGVHTWTSSPGPNESRPITCLSWFDAVAFCIWDGGFLPSEAEWNYAAAGGAEQRAYPWSSPPRSLTIDSARAVFGTSGVEPVGERPEGVARWEHADLAGNAWEWTLDVYGRYPSPCDDCVADGSGTYRVMRGGSFVNDASTPLASFRFYNDPSHHFAAAGARCARTP